MPRMLDRIRAGSRSLLYVHCGTSTSYPERALVLARRSDLVCVNDEIEPAYLEYLAELGIGPAPANIIVVAGRSTEADESGPLPARLLGDAETLDRMASLMRGRGTVAIHPFMATSHQLELARGLSERLGHAVQVIGGDPDLVAYAEGKNHIRQAAIELGIPVAPGGVIDLGSSVERDGSRLRTVLSRHLRHTGRIIVRGAHGAAGTSSCAARYGEIELLAALLLERTDNQVYLVEAMVDATASPSVQMHIDGDGCIACVGVTDRRLDSSVAHLGNVAPRARCLTKIVGWAHCLAEWLRNAGYVGIAGFDFVEYTGTRGEPRAFLAELNPRVNDGMYPLAVLEQFQEAGAFVSGIVSTEVETFAELRATLGELLFTRERGEGVLPYATGTLKHGSCLAIALASAREEAAELYAEAELRMAASCVS
jgi:biotin carboxylase